MRRMPASHIESRDPDSLTLKQVVHVVAAFPNLSADLHEPRTMEAAWRKLKGIEPRSTARDVERLKRLGVRPSEAQRLAADYRNTPEVLRANDCECRTRGRARWQHEPGRAADAPTQ